MNKLQKLALLGTAAAVSVQAHAGKLADAITTNQTVIDAQADLFTVGGTVIGLVVVSVVFGAAIRLFRKGG